MSEKKSEKLEIRLSYEDKQELAAVAETEGRSVSDLVRGLIRRYIQTTSKRLPDTRFWKRLWPSMMGLAIAAFMAGHIATWAYTRSHDHADIYNLYASVGTNYLTTPVLAKHDYNSSIILTDDAGDISVSLKVETKAQDLAILRAEICRMTEGECKNISSPILYFNPSSPASININDDGVDEIFMRLSRAPK